MSPTDAATADAGDEGCAVCGGDVADRHAGQPFCQTHLDAVLGHAGPDPNPGLGDATRRCGYCCAPVVHHDDVVPWRCTASGRLLRDVETTIGREGCA